MAKPRGTGRLCSIEGCGRPDECRGWCQRHYASWRRTGNPIPVQRGPVPTPPHERVLARTLILPEGCWIYEGTLSAGYGMVQLRRPDGTRAPDHAHRVVYKALVGPIPDGFDVHHECKVRACVNPEHLTVMDRGDHSRHHIATSRPWEKRWPDKGAA